VFIFKHIKTTQIKNSQIPGSSIVLVKGRFTLFLHLKMKDNCMAFQDTCPLSTHSAFDSNFSHDFFTDHDTTHFLDPLTIDITIPFSLIVILFCCQLALVVLMVVHSWTSEADDETEPEFVPGPGPRGDGTYIHIQIVINNMIVHGQNVPN
jgi:hypothetical protein